MYFSRNRSLVQPREFIGSTNHQFGVMIALHCSVEFFYYRWEKLKSWNTVQTAILAILSSNESDNSDDVVTHGLKVGAY